MLLLSVSHLGSKIHSHSAVTVEVDMLVRNFLCQGQPRLPFTFCDRYRRQSDVATLCTCHSSLVSMYITLKQETQGLPLCIDLSSYFRTSANSSFASSSQDAVRKLHKLYMISK